MIHDHSSIAHTSEQANSLAAAKSIRFLQEMLEVHRNYIRLVNEQSSQLISYAHVHGWRCSDKMILQGRALRAHMRSLNKEYYGDDFVDSFIPEDGPFVPQEEPPVRDLPAITTTMTNAEVLQSLNQSGAFTSAPATATPQPTTTPVLVDSEAIRARVSQMRDPLEDLYYWHLGRAETLQMTYALARDLKHLAGDYVEFGIAYGASIAAMKRAAPEKVVWGFDSFEGIPLAGRRDQFQPGIPTFLDPNRVLPENMLVSSGVTVMPWDSVQDQLKAWGFDPAMDFVLVKGWVENTVPIAVQPVESRSHLQSLALLRVDLDLHDPTKLVLEHCWPLLVEGGGFIVDDWSLKGVRDAVEEYFARINYTPNWVGDINAEHPVYLLK